MCNWRIPFSFWNITDMYRILRKKTCNSFNALYICNFLRYGSEHVGQTSHTHSALEIDLMGHSYQTHCAGCQRQHVGVGYPAGKMFCLCTLLLE
jgi:hypothetical protein